MDAGALVLDFQGRGVDLPIDYEHQIDAPTARLYGPVPAAGWIKELSHDENGLWGRVEWTATAGEMIARKEYRYVSPSFMHAAGQIVRLNDAGLVHKPALRLKALAHEEPSMGPQFQRPDTGPDKTKAAPSMTRVLEALGLQSDATDADSLDALQFALGQKAPLLSSTPATANATAGQHPDPARHVPIEVVRELMADRNTRLATLREQDATAKVSAALRDGHITPAMRDWATALCAAEPASFDAFIAKSPAPYAHLHGRLSFAALPATGAPLAASAEALAICAQLGLSPDRLAKG